ncbi:NAD-dependent epimerase/dehydratase family protein [Microcella daejeonensis]|uniref:NAD-dependent epimerase/dehydratase family protein n=1 Tax=Microcella daejeonensis TaxID=2994971 RepID=UPI00226E49CE|nr:NAD-dependent epimerase/dehydratase family protein [Microcella daejeonensis]WAB84689.1 NAD-dependent epimerase/dehydratase family protein [Microcella daejeonensis]
MIDARKRVLVLGATGVVGSAATERFIADDQFDVVAASRRIARLPSRDGVVAISLDLLDAPAVRAAFTGHGPITHVVYAALFEKPDLIAGWEDPEQIDTNRRMFGNVIDAIRAVGAPVQHMSILQGTKAYGFHVQQMRIPAKESQPRVEHQNFYWEQEDLLIPAAGALGFSYTIFRPQFIFGGALGAAMNLIPVIGCYAALCNEQGRPFSFPGGASYVAEGVDSRLLADALHWASGAASARNETFNITNGDVFEWRDLWAQFAADLGATLGPDAPFSLAQWMPQQEASWRRIVARHDLRNLRLSEIVGLSHEYADNAFSYTPDGTPLGSRATPVLLSTIKLRQAGFTACTDTADTFRYWFDRLSADRVLPERRDNP